MSDREKVHTPRSLAAILNPGVDRPPASATTTRTTRVEGQVQTPSWQTLRERVFDVAGEMELVLFRVGAECFALPLESVSEVIDSAVFHQLPEMPAHVTGVIAVAGRSLALYDGRQFLGVASTSSQPSVLIMKGEVEDAGLVVDVLLGSSPVDLSAVKRVPALEDASGALVGVFFHDAELVALLDPAAFARQRESAKAAQAEDAP